MAHHPSLHRVRVLAFDTFGTVTDWHTGIAAAVSRVVPDVDAGAFARDWRRRYPPIMAQVEAGVRPWAGLDDLQAQTLRAVAHDHGITLDGNQVHTLVRSWRQIPGWPDAATGLSQLRQRYTVCALSNGSVALLLEMAKKNGFDWDFIGGSDQWHHYKPAAEAYLGLARLLEAQPDEVMMVATHQSDLDAARANGLRTAYIVRPDEWGPAGKDNSGSPENDLHAEDVIDLANQLAAVSAGVSADATGPQTVTERGLDSATGSS